MTLGFGAVNLGERGRRRFGGPGPVSWPRRSTSVFACSTPRTRTGTGRASGCSVPHCTVDADEAFVATKGGYLFRERGAVEQGGRRSLAGRLRRRSPAIRRRQWLDRRRRLRTRAGLLAAPPPVRRRGLAAAAAHRPHRPVSAARTARGRCRISSASSSTCETPARCCRSASVPRTSPRPRPGSPCRRSTHCRSPSACSTRRRPTCCSPGSRTARSTSGRGVCSGAACSPPRRSPELMAEDPRAPTIEELRHLADASGLGLDALAIAFVGSFAEVSTILVGISSSEHLRRNVSLFSDPQPDPDVVARVRAIVFGEELDGRT